MATVLSALPFLATSWEVTGIAITGQERLIGDSREFQDVRETGVKTARTEFRLRAMVLDKVNELVNLRADPSRAPALTGGPRCVAHGA